jgi:predicted methyltransferase
MSRTYKLVFPILFWLASGTTLAANEEELGSRLQALIDSDSRSEDARDRNQYRHPLETLSFFGLSPEQTVVEIWPGGRSGWYRSILEPFFENQPGRYIPVTNNSSFPDPVDVVPDNSADMVLVFRAHGFLIYDQPLHRYYDELFRMVKPGGVFGIVDHRELETRTQDPKGENGYIKETYLITLAENAGFQFLEKTEINANPQDTKDYPDGLYSLPPTLRGTMFNRRLRASVLEIGESDRMTMKFVKPE